MTTKNRSKLNMIKKIVLIVLLLAFIVFTYMQQDEFLKSVTYLYDKPIESSEATGESFTSLKGSRTVSQQFEAMESTLDNIGIYFYNPKVYESSGSISVSVFDPDDKRLCKASIDAKKAIHNDAFFFEFTGKMDQLNFRRELSTHEVAEEKAEKIRLKKGAIYNIVIESKDLSSPDDIGIFTVDAPASSQYELVTEEGNVTDKALAMEISYWKFLIPVFSIFLIITCFAIGIICLPESLIEKYVSQMTIQRVMFFLTPLVCYAILSKFSGDTTLRTVKQMITEIGLLNILVIGLLWWIIYVICNRVKITTISTTIVVFLFGFTCYLLYLFRGSQLTAGDLFNIETGFSVISTYRVTFDKSAIWAIMIMLIWVCLAINFKGHKGLPFRKRLIPLAILCLWAVSFNMIFFKSDYLEKNSIRISSFSPDRDYRKYGYAFAFTVTATNMRIKKPNDYDPSKVEQLSEKYISDKATKANTVSKQHPNIIAIMNESLTDFDCYGNIRTNKDPMPFIHSLKDNTVKGTMHSSVFGARTANSEFEFLTGFTCAFLPYGTVAYNGHVQEGTPSLTSVLKDQNYGGMTAFHPGKVDSYNRDVVYRNFGFDKYISLEDLDDPKNLRAYVSDEYDYSVIIDEYEKYLKEGGRSPYYMFNVTIQNHASYSKKEGEVNRGIDLLNEDIRYNNPVIFLNLIKASDDAFKQLIEYFEDVDEPTVVLIFGDHQPQFKNDFYYNLLGGSEDSLSLEQLDKKYQVPFIIWANYDIEEEKDIEASANYLRPYLLKSIGAEMTGFDKYLLDLHSKIPVISAISYIDNDGRAYNYDDKTEYTDLLEQYKIVQYNGLVDQNNRVDSFFRLQGR